MPERRRILMFLENNAYSRDVRVRQEAQSLQQAGYSVTVLAPRAPNGKWHETVNGVVLYNFPEPPGGNGLAGYAMEYGYAMFVMFWLSLYVFIRRGFDVIHLHNPPDSLIFIAQLYRIFGKRCVYDHHDLSPELYYYSRFQGNGNPRVYGVLKWLESMSCRLANHVIVVNESYRDLDIERAKIPAEKVTIVRNGPDLKKLVPVAQPDDKKAKVTIGYLGMIGFQDGVSELIDVVHHMVNVLKRTDFACLVVGGGAALDAMRQKARDLQLEDYITFTGWVEYAQVPGYISQFDICAAPEPPNPYNDRCTMIKMMEYMTFTVPVVCFDLTEHRRTAGDAALYAHTKEEYAENVVRLMDDPALRRSMGAAGRARVENVLAWEHQAKALVGVYDRLFQTARQYEPDAGR